MSGSEPATYTAKTCVVCGAPADPAIGTVTETAGSATIQHAFCTAAHREQYSAYPDVYNGSAHLLEGP